MTGVADQAHASDLQRILDAHPGREVVLFPPTIGWRLPFLFQRPQQMAVALARRGALVLFCEPDYKSRFPDGFTELEEGLFIANVPMQAFAGLESPVVVVLSYSAQHLSALRRPRVVYDYLDSMELAELKGRFARLHRVMLARATVVTASATRLLDDARGMRPDALLLPNAVDLAHFRRARALRDGAPPTDLAGATVAGRPRVGYVGVLSEEWIDYDLLHQLATARPDVQLVLIGLDYDGSLLKSRLLTHGNVSWLGAKPYDVLPEYLAHLDAALVPFRVSTVTQSSSPVKLFEYLAAGLPVVTTDLPEPRKYAPVLVAGDADGFVAAVGRALSLTHDAGFLADADAIARANTWDERARVLLDALAAAAEPAAELARARRQIEQLGALSSATEDLVEEQRAKIDYLERELDDRARQPERRDQVALRLQSSLRAEVAERHATVPELHRQILELARELEASRVPPRPASPLRAAGDRLVKLGQEHVGSRIPYEWRSRLRRLVGLQPKPRPLSAANPLPVVARPESVDDVPARYDVVCFPIIDWNFRFQRPQQLMRQFARAGHRVFYVNPQSLLEGLYLAGEGPEPRVAELEPDVFDVRLPACTELNIYRDVLDPTNCETMFASLTGLARKFHLTSVVACVQLPFWLELVLRLRALGWRVVYDCMDEHGGFESNTHEMVALERRLLEASDHVVVSSQKLLEKVRDLAPSASLIPNACEYEHFAPAVERDPASELVGLPHPIVGYYGAISEWFDFDFIRDAAKAHPEWSFVLIGSTWGAPPHDDLKMWPNVHFLGEKPYAELPALLSQFDVATIPFRLSPLIEATSPVKLFEYLAAGKPVVASELPELEPLGDLVWRAATPKDFTAAVADALAASGAAEVERRRAYARQNTWSERQRAFAADVVRTFGRVSVVIVTWNNLDYTRQCVASLRADQTWPDVELIFVDNGSSDGTVAYLEKLRAEDPRVVVVLNADNRGFAAANNQGIALATGAFVALLNNDTIVTRGWLVRLVHHLERDPTIGLIGPVTNNVWNEARQEAGYPDVGGLASFAEDWAWAHAGKLYPIRVLAMYCVVARRSVLEQVGALDERFGIGMFEDDDYAHRVRLAGYRVVCAEEVYIHHAGRASFAKLPERDYQALHDVNRRKYDEKWATRWQPHTGDRAANLRWRDEVDALVAAHPDAPAVVVFPPSIGWAIDLFQRPQQLALAFGRLGCLVFFCLHDYDAPAGPALRTIGPNVYLSSVPLEAFENVRGAQVMTMPYNAWFTAFFPAPRLVYEVVDELEVFPGDPALLRAEHERLCREAMVVVATATRLADKVRPLRHDVVLNRNGVDVAHFDQPQIAAAAEIARLAGPVIGYYGALARWVDYDLIAQVAQLRPDYQFVLIGPDHDGTLAASGVTRLANVHALGSRPYAELPSYLAGFAVATIPFRVDELTRSVSPLKLFEYLAGGKPVVSTDLPECRDIAGVLIASGADDYAAKLDHALQLGREEGFALRMREIAREHTWESRARAILDAVEIRAT